MGEQPAKRGSTARAKPAQEPATALAAHAPWIPGTFAPEDIGAIQALARGQADEATQRRALQFIIDFCHNDGAHYFPGEAGRRDTDFALGRASVGKQIVNMVKFRLKPHGEQP